MSEERRTRYLVAIPEEVSGEVAGRLTALDSDVEGIRVEGDMWEIQVLLDDDVADEFRAWFNALEIPGSDLRKA